MLYVSSGDSLTSDSGQPPTEIRIHLEITGTEYGGGWWLPTCGGNNLNEVYYEDYFYAGYWETVDVMKRSEMKIRLANTEP